MECSLLSLEVVPREWWGCATSNHAAKSYCQKLWTKFGVDHIAAPCVNEYIEGKTISKSKKTTAESQAEQVSTVGSDIVTRHFKMRYDTSRSFLLAR